MARDSRIAKTCVENSNLCGWWKENIVIWETIAEGDSLETLRTVRSRKLAKGTRVRFTMTTRAWAGIPTARAFDLPGAELIFRPVMPEGMRLLDVHSPDDRELVVVEAEVITNPAVTTSAIVAFVAANWFRLSLVAIGITVALGFLVTSIRIDAEVIPHMWAMLLIAVVIIAVVFILARAGVRAGKVTIGGT